MKMIYLELTFTVVFSILLSLYAEGQSPSNIKFQTIEDDLVARVFGDYYSLPLGIDKMIEVDSSGNIMDNSRIIQRDLNGEFTLYYNGLENGDYIFFSDSVVIMRTYYPSGMIKSFERFFAFDSIEWNGLGYTRKHGLSTYFHPNGMIKQQIQYREGRMDTDTVFTYDEKGRLRRKNIVKDRWYSGEEWKYDKFGNIESKIDQETGLYITYWPNGQIRVHGYYEEKFYRSLPDAPAKVGKWEYFDKDGNLIKIDNYE